MASFTGVGNSVTLFVPDRGVRVDVAISGTYEMVIALQKEVASKGSGVWQTVPGFYYNAHDDTIAASYTTREFGESLRLVVLEDTDGTATATLTAATKQLKVFTDDVGNELAAFYSGGFVPTLAPVSITAAVTLNREQHAFRPLVFNIASGAQATLPTATGSGDVYNFYIGTTVTSNAAVINAFESPTAGLMQGVICGVDDEAEFTWGSEIGADNQVSLGGTSGATGGQVGDWITCVDIAAGVWSVNGFVHHGTGTEANPFSTDS